MELPEARDRLQNWLLQSAFPLWAQTGTDPKGGFFEKLTPEGVASNDPRRARVVGRQIFAFAVADRLGWNGPARDRVEHGLAALSRAHLRPGGVILPLAAADGTTLSRAFDLYDHAFVLFALAAAYGLTDDPDALVRQAQAVRHRMYGGWKHPHAGFEESSPRTLPLKANPHMHLLEASLAWDQVAPEAGWRQMADEIAELCLARFISAQTGAVREYYDGDWQALADPAGSVVEPGHQFEWAWLLIRWGTLRARPDAIAAARRLITLAEAHGVDPARGLAVNELNADLSLRDARARLWPQTERIKAHLALADLSDPPETRLAAQAKAAEAVQGLMCFFDHPVPGAWWEHLDGAGQPIREPARASSLYHITCAMDVLAAHAV